MSETAFCFLLCGPRMGIDNVVAYEKQMVEGGAWKPDTIEEQKKKSA